MKIKNQLFYLFIFSFSSILILTSCNNDDESEPTFSNELDEDINYFSENLTELHPNLFDNISEKEFDFELAMLRLNSSRLSKEEVWIELHKVLAKVGDPHTTLSLSESTFMPFRFSLLSDGPVLTAIGQENDSYLGREIVGINGRPMFAIVDSFRTVIPYDNEQIFKLYFESYFRVLEFHQHFLFGGEELVLDFVGNEQVRLKNEFSEFAYLTPTSIPLFMQNQDQYYWSEILEEEETLYLNYNSCQELISPTFLDFTIDAIKTIEQNSNIQKLVLDLRDNGGGNSAIARPLIDELDRLVQEGRLVHDSIFIIIGKNTFSSAILNALSLKDRIDPVFIGEATGGRPNHYGEVKELILPNTQWKVRYSSRYFQVTEEDSDALYPDIEVLYTIEDLINGNDPVMNVIRDL